MSILNPPLLRPLRGPNDPPDESGQMGNKTGLFKLRQNGRQKPKAQRQLAISAQDSGHQSGPSSISTEPHSTDDQEMANSEALQTAPTGVDVSSLNFSFSNTSSSAGSSKAVQPNASSSQNNVSNDNN